MNGRTLAVLIGLWGVATAVPLATLMAAHDLPLPAASIQPMAALAMPQQGDWRVIHVLADGCPCSGSVADALIERKSAAGALELAVVEPVSAKPTGKSLALRMKAGGFAVSDALPADVARQLHIEGGPWLVIVRPDGQVAYSGGYASVRPRQGTPLSDQTILKRLQQGEAVDPLPAYGCATSRRLQQTIDPLGLKYGD
jgi:hypothetical protein